MQRSHINLTNEQKDKIARFYQKESDAKWSESGFAASQLNDTRYISRLALAYMQTICQDVSVTKDFVVAKLHHQWGFYKFFNDSAKKDRSDYRHHAIDAVVIAANLISVYQKAVQRIVNNRLHIAKPYPHIREELAEKLKHMIISHATSHKISGGLHKETGAGYIEKHGGLVYRKALIPNFTIKNAQSIVDETVRNIVISHINNYKNTEEAFSETVFHQDSKTPIKRVLVLQSKTTAEELQQNKFGVKDKSGKIFKYIPYGNTI